VPLEDFGDGLRVADVDPLEVVARVVDRLGERPEVAGIRQLVDVDDLGIGLADPLADDGGADESGASVLELHPGFSCNLEDAAMLRSRRLARAARDRSLGCLAVLTSDRRVDAARTERAGPSRKRIM
jgi:hypothetical protein